MGIRGMQFCIKGDASIRLSNNSKSRYGQTGGEGGVSSRNPDGVMEFATLSVPPVYGGLET